MEQEKKEIGEQNESLYKQAFVDPLGMIDSKKVKPVAINTIAIVVVFFLLFNESVNVLSGTLFVVGMLFVFANLIKKDETENGVKDDA